MSRAQRTGRRGSHYEVEAITQKNIQNNIKICSKMTVFTHTKTYLQPSQVPSEHFSGTTTLT